MTINYHRLLVVRFLCSFGAICILALWIYERSTGLLTTYDFYAYPALLFLILITLIISFLGGKWRKYSDILGVVVVSCYFLGAAINFSFDPSVYLYIVANTMQWLGVLVVAFFIVFSNYNAVAFASIFLICIYSPIFLRAAYSGFDYWEPSVALIIANSMAIDVAILISLTTVQGLHKRLLHNNITIQKMANLAYFDNLTGARTRAGLEYYLDRSLVLTEQRLLVLVDVDNLKTINDTQGHDIGDKSLAIVSQSLLELLPEDAVISRWGGDEFIFISTIPESSTVTDFLYKVHTGVCTAIKTVDPELSVSFGATLWHSADRSFADQFRLADISLYQAKRNGKATVVFNG